MSRKKFTEEIKHLYNKGILTEAAIEILKTEKNNKRNGRRIMYGKNYI